MKVLILAAAMTFLMASAANASSIWVTGQSADAIVNPLVAVGMDEPYTHEYFQAGVVACAKLFDDKGDYFPGGKVGDYVGEECLLYGASAPSDSDGRWQPRVLIPQDDRELKKNPEIATKLAQFRAIRESLEAIVFPIVRTQKVDGREIVIAQTSGFGGIGCDGRNARGERICQILISPKCPARHP